MHRKAEVSRYLVDGVLRLPAVSELLWYQWREWVEKTQQKVFRHFYVLMNYRRDHFQLGQEVFSDVRQTTARQHEVDSILNFVRWAQDTYSGLHLFHFEKFLLGVEHA